MFALCCGARDPTMLLVELEKKENVKANQAGVRSGTFKITIVSKWNEKRADGDVPVIVHGENLEGWVQLDASGPMHGLKVMVISRKVMADSSIALETLSPVLTIKPRTSDELIASDNQVPFSIPADHLPPTPSYAGGHFSIEHAVKVRVLDGNNASKSESHQPFALRCPVTVAPSSPTSSPEGVWLTVGDFGGTCRMTLVGSSHTIDLRQPSIEGHLRIDGLPKLKRVSLKLMAIEDQVEHTCYALDLLPDALSLGPGASCTRDFSLPLRGASGDPLFAPDVPAGPFGSVEHCLRLVLEPVDMNEAWNSLPIKLVHGGAMERKNSVSNLANHV
ncbi:hypothetical protein AB1Y20_014950 [Prymnesium parvum]|uniref:Uncharacterized protein n=1 Tax=Prymnesium parvum TaxID=97485 RepID=A0AB34JZ95_PRYPA